METVRTGLKSLFKFQKEERSKAILKLTAGAFLSLWYFKKERIEMDFFFACMNETLPSFPPIFLSCSTPHFYHRNVIPPLTFLCGLFSVTQAWLGCRNLLLCLSALLACFPMSPLIFGNAAAVN